MSKPTEDQINDVLNECDERTDDGNPKYPGMSYEQGIKYAIAWMRGEGPNPLED